MKRWLAILILLPLLPLFTLEEEFENIDNWKNLSFPKIEKPSQYRIRTQDETTILEARSDGGASGLIYRHDFSVYQTPILSWRWKVEDILEKGDVRIKKGDDYAIRLYVIFEYDPEKVDRLTRIKYSMARLIYGEYPPDSALNYVWANKKWDSPTQKNAYTNRAIMISSDEGERFLGDWREHRVDILEDYRKAFGKEPPEKASLAIMTDSDNTEESTLAWLEYIKLEKEE
jgi:hypothetical protein